MEYACCLCIEQGVRRLAVSVPVIVVPVVDYPIPLYLQFRGALCHAHTAAFTINQFTDHLGSWYEMAADHIRAQRKPAANPFPKLAWVPAGGQPPSNIEGFYKCSSIDPASGLVTWERQFDFTWEENILNPNFEPAPITDCYLQFWQPKTLAAKGAHYTPRTIE